MPSDPHLPRAVLAALAAYNAAWNEPEPDSIRAHLERSVAPDVVFADPANVTAGIDALETLIRTSRTEMPSARFELASGIDGGHDGRYRYRWHVRVDGDVMSTGMDVTAIEAGRITRIDGFFGDFPPLV